MIDNDSKIKFAETNKTIRSTFNSRYFCSVFSKCWFLKMLGFGWFFGGPGGFDKLREACRNNFHQVSSRSELVVPSYDKRTKMLTTKKLGGLFGPFKGL